MKILAAAVVLTPLTLLFAAAALLAGNHAATATAALELCAIMRTTPADLAGYAATNAAELGPDRSHAGLTRVDYNIHRGDHPQWTDTALPTSGDINVVAATYATAIVNGDSPSLFAAWLNHGTDPATWDTVVGAHTIGEWESLFQQWRTANSGVQTNCARPEPAPATAVAGCVDEQAILLTIRTLESHGDYQARNAHATASGAYQYIDSTWNNFGGYPSAYLAPPPVQDARALVDVRRVIANYGDTGAVPATWYVGHLPPPGDHEWDTVPRPDAGNTLTIRQYQTRWLTEYQTHLDTGLCPTTAPANTSYTLPLPAGNLQAAQLNQPHHDYPAIDLITPTGTPVFAVAAGRVTATQHFNANWWANGCTQTGLNGCATCGLGITITDTTGTRWTYCHLSHLGVEHGATVTTGQQLGLTGNTGRSGTPHLHLEIRTTPDTQHCPQPFLTALFSHTPPPNPATLPTTGCSF